MDDSPTSGYEGGLLKNLNLFRKNKSVDGPINLGIIGLWLKIQDCLLRDVEQLQQMQWWHFYACLSCSVWGDHEI